MTPHDDDVQVRHEKQLAEQDMLLADIDKKMGLLLGEIPVNFKERFLAVESRVKQIAETLEKSYVGRVEFEVLRVEHNQMKLLMHGFIITVLVGLLGTALVYVGWKR
jgi:hypothetical protein